jgi:hypothetical protein
MGILARLGHVIYWIFSGAAVLAFLAIVASAFNDRNIPADDRAYALAGAVLFALPLWLVGLGCRYILSGPKGG